ncbi:hypothetical protein IGI04_007142 [Brassica rapa subsp. trilocularis]|uniref:Uncharacterized protein n=1 Tax=Brassica rapa subsp. trilocularis TaxID=1813537 RepID=A0ABQ7NIV5_BRACM|nr:hypothetical protein IGI04_007142 [Brassica rapa subsp. trilocularis]
MVLMKKVMMDMTLIVVTSHKHKKKKMCIASSIRRGSGSQRSGEHSRLPIRSGSGSSEGRRRQSFETTIHDTIAGYTEFQRQSLQQLHPCAFDQENYDEWKKAEEIFPALNISKRKILLNIIDDDKLQLLEAMVGVSRNNERCAKIVRCIAIIWKFIWSTVGYTTNCSIMGYPTVFSAMGHTTKRSTMGNTSKCFTIGNTT